MQPLSPDQRLAELPQAEHETAHHFLPGIYVREMIMPAGSLVVGKCHTTHHGCYLLKGEMTVFAAGERHDLVAPQIFEAKPGRKVILTRSDVVFQNLHVTQETDLDAIEAAVIDGDAPWSDDELAGLREAMCACELMVEAG